MRQQSGFEPNVENTFVGQTFTVSLKTNSSGGGAPVQINKSK